MNTSTNTERIIYSIELDELVRRICDEMERRMGKRGVSVAQSVEQPLVEELLTREQAARLLGITLPTLREYTRRGWVDGYRIGTRVRYKRSEVLGSLKLMQTAKQAGL